MLVLKNCWSDITYLHRSHHSCYFSILEGISSVPQLLGHHDCCHTAVLLYVSLTHRQNILDTDRPSPIAHYCFLCSFSVKIAVTITATQTNIAVTLADTRTLLLTSAHQQNVSCTITLLASKAIYLCLAVNRFLAPEPLWSHQASSKEQGRSDMQELQQYLSPSAN